MTEDLKDFSTPQRIADEGERLYREKHQAALEKTHAGQFAVINVMTGDVYTGKFPEEALDTARKAAPNGVFHLLRVGSTGAYHVSYLLHGREDEIAIPLVGR